MQLTRKGLEAIDLEELRDFVGPSEWFYEKPGKEMHRLLAYLSTFFRDRTIFDIGTHFGDSAHALAFNSANSVESFDVVDDVPRHRHRRANITYHRSDLFEPVTRDQWKHRLLESALIFIDVDSDDGVRQYEFVRWLQANDYEGIIVLDDIWFLKAMRDNLWYRIEGRYKLDVTRLGHWSGTGIVSFHEKVTLEGDRDTSNWTLVTGYFDLTSLPDATPAIKSRPPSMYLDENGTSTLALEQNLVVFTEPDYRHKILELRPQHLHAKTSVITMSFDDFPLTRHRERIIQNRNGSSGCPSDSRNTASYYLFCMARYAMLKQAMEMNPFGSTHFAWINICIERMGFKNLVHIGEALMQQRDKFSTCYIDYVDKRTSMNFETNFCGARCLGRCTMCSGFFTGSAHYMRAVCDKIERQFSSCLEAGYGHADEQLMNLVYFDDPSLFDWYIGDYTEMITNYAFVHERPERPLENLIRNSFAQRDYDVCLRACELLLNSHDLGKAELTREDLETLRTTKAASEQALGHVSSPST